MSEPHEGMNAPGPYFEALMGEQEVYELAQSLQGADLGIVSTDASRVRYMAYPSLTLGQSLAIHEIAERLLDAAGVIGEYDEITMDIDVEDLDAMPWMTQLMNRTNKCFRIGMDRQDRIDSRYNSIQVDSDRGDFAVITFRKDPYPIDSKIDIDDIIMFLNIPQMRLLVLVGTKGQIYCLSKNKGKYDQDKALDCFFRVPHYRTEYGEEIYDSRDMESPVSLSSGDVERFLSRCKGFGIDFWHAFPDARHGQHET